MTDRVKKQYDILKDGSYKNHRVHTPIPLDGVEEQASPMVQSAQMFRAMLESEKPWVHPGERIGFNRSGSQYPPYGTFGLQPGEKRYLSGNVTLDFETFLNKGFDGIRDVILDKTQNADVQQTEFYQCLLMTMDAALDYAQRMRQAAKDGGCMELYDSLGRVPWKPANSLLDACVFMKFIIFTTRCNYNEHITLGRFDRYMRPFYEHDLAAGKTRQELMEVLEEFFISINLDTDLYKGIQIGDNGQSMILGGCDEEGNEVFSDFSHLIMEASLDLSLIDPKINLRVNKNTPMELLEFATLMTKQGLGFPQYCNDDVVIPGLIKLGYAPEDAANYTVAACWEFIIPALGNDVPNIGTMNFPKVVEQAVYEHLMDCKTFEELLERVCQEIWNESDILIERANRRIYYPSPYYSLFNRNCLETGRDVSQKGAKYRNYGFHGAGVSTAVDSLAAIRQMIYETDGCTKETLLEALKNNFEGYDQLRNQLRACPKMGNNEDRVDAIATRLLDAFSTSLKGKTNSMGGIFRPGTGSAMAYVYAGEAVGATADGRKAGDVFGCSFSPSIDARLEGPLSCIRSFTKYDLTNVINGGPLTMEIHDSTFRNQEGIRKVAQLVKTFIMLGGHQLQLNSVNRDRLLDAQAHPENYKNLIVRVWGWSGYFTELDKVYQDHIIRRTEFKS